MKRIENPSMNKLIWVLIVPLAMMLLNVIFARTYVPVTVIFYASLVLFLILAGYHCIRQKCYTQFACSLIMAALWGAMYYFLYCATITPPDFK